MLPRTLITALLLTCCSLLPCLANASPENAIAARVPPALAVLYQQRQFAPLWLEHGQTTPRAAQAIEQLKAAPVDGLRTSDYALSRLEQMQLALAQSAGDEQQQAAFDLLLSQAVARYTGDLVLGRVDPQALDIAIDTSPRRAALPGQIAQVLTAPDIAVALQALQPTFSRYTRLRAILPGYRAMAQEHPEPPALPALPLVKNKPTALKPGAAWDGTAALGQWLVVLGDMPAGQQQPGTAMYTGALVDGVKHFQARHGMTADGVIGSQTRQMLMTPLATRVTQIELAMERLRWIDSNVESRPYILINIPQFTLWAHEPGDGAPNEVLRMGVIVGKSLKTRTPSMTKTVSTAVFSPYWNVPRSIAIKELTPKLRREPGYLVSEEMEMVGSDGSIYRGEVDEAKLTALAHGDYRIRQRPGEHNALGGVKFVFPNDDNVYMHDTPQKNLFAKDRRDFSHGCIRLADPAALALYVLQANGNWDEARIQAQMVAGEEQHIPLKQKIPVLLLYFTANVNRDGNAEFAQDIYQQDPILESVLATRPHLE